MDEEHRQSKDDALSILKEKLNKIFLDCKKFLNRNTNAFINTFIKKFKSTDENKIKDQLSNILKVVLANKHYIDNNDVEHDALLLKKLIRFLRTASKK